MGFFNLLATILLWKEHISQNVQQFIEPIHNSDLSNYICSICKDTLMIKIGLIKEGKIPADNRVALTPAQCKWIHKNLDSVQIIVQSSSTRCFSDREFSMAGAEVKDDVSDCDILLGIKEVPVEQLVAKKTYLFFSHTKKEQPQKSKIVAGHP